MGNQFYYIFSLEDLEYKGMTDCNISGKDEILLQREKFDVNTQSISYVNGEIRISDNLDKKQQYQNELHQERIKTIDYETQKEIMRGFSFDGQTFSLSPNAQLNWQNLVLLHQSGHFKDQSISTMDDSTYYLTEDKLLDFFKTSCDRLAEILTNGRRKKDQLKLR